MLKEPGYDNHSASVYTFNPGSGLFASHSIDGENEHSESWCDGGAPLDGLLRILCPWLIDRGGSE